MIRIATKLSFSLVTAGFIIFGIYGVYHLRTERVDLRRVVEHETRLLGYSLQVAIENALRDQQHEDVRMLLKQLETIEPLIQIRVYTRDAKVIAPNRKAPSFEDSFEHQLKTTVSEHSETMLFHPADEPEKVGLALPLASSDALPLGSMVLMRALPEMRRDLQATKRDILISVFAFVLIAFLLGLALGTVYITRPLSRLIEAMSRVRSGDLMALLSIHHRDETGTLASEFNAMVAELRKTRRNLEEEAESRRRMQRALQEADKLITIGQLSAGLAHEIGSPLQILSGRAQALLGVAQNPGEVRKNAQILVAQTERIKRIVQHLLQFARRRPPSFARTDLYTAVKDVLDLLQYEVRRRRITLTFSCDRVLPPVLADADGIQQVVLNLVTNALAAMPPEGNISVSLEPTQLRIVALGREVQAARLIVADTGCGMSQETLGRLFEPFFTTRAGEGGTGLGLAVVQSIVTEHGGALMVESTVDRGSRFRVDLPVNGPLLQPQRLQP
jgi:signal transduction histidine kinase